jgi:hypothetical protein
VLSPDLRGQESVGIVVVVVVVVVVDLRHLEPRGCSKDSTEYEHEDRKGEK